jgi:hypothetical protein
MAERHSGHLERDPESTSVIAIVRLQSGRFCEPPGADLHAGWCGDGSEKINFT